MINLLPPAYKKELQEEQRFRLLLVWAFSLCVFLICFMLMLVVLRLYLKTQVRSEKFFTAIPQKELAVQNQIIANLKQTNTNFSALSRLYAKRLSPATILSHLEKDLPLDLSLVDLEMSFSGISLQGFAPTRDSLLTFRKNLEADSLFNAIDFPLTNIATEQNITFTIQMQLQANK